MRYKIPRYHEVVRSELKNENILILIYLDYLLIINMCCVMTKSYVPETGGRFLGTTGSDFCFWYNFLTDSRSLE